MPIIALALLLALQRPEPSACLGVASSRAGFTWTYSGTRLDVARDGREKPARVSWTTTVVDTRAAGQARLVLIRGFVTELAWQEGPAAPKLSILVCSAGSLLRFEGSSDKETRAAFVQWHDSLLIRSRLFLQTPLDNGRVFGQDPPREDALYGWEVETLARPSRLPRSCGAVRGGAYRLTYRTTPDLTTLDWQDGVGVARYTYQHHGTPSRVDVQLASCGLPANSPHMQSVPG